MVKQVLKRLLGRSRGERRSRGYTLIEVLVAALIGSLVVTGLLTFVVGALDRDRREEAKATTQTELQDALDFIADDMQEAVYIYDATGLNAIYDQLPAISNAYPVLVFWKRYSYEAGDNRCVSTTDDKYCGEEEKIAANPTQKRYVRCMRSTTTSPIKNCTGSDEVVYALVAYYLRKDDDTGAKYKGARIDRFEMRGGIVSTCTSQTDSASPNCGLTAQRPSGEDPTDTNFYYRFPTDPAFRGFDSSGGGTLSDRMNEWTKSNGAYDLSGNVRTLLYFIDDTAYNSNQDAIGATANVKVPVSADTVDTNPSVTGVQAACANPNIGGAGVGAQRIPADFTKYPDGTALPSVIQFSSFYACVNSTQNVARIFLRGNAIARLNPDPNNRILASDDTARRGADTGPIAYANASQFVPTSDVRVFARGLLR